MLYNRRIYGRFLSALAEEFNSMDFLNYCPSEIIDQFWTKHNWKDGNLNVFLLILSARRDMRPIRHAREDVEEFLRDFASFMIASYTTHCLNHDGRKIGKYMFEDEAENLKEAVRMDFLNRLIGLK